MVSYHDKIFLRYSFLAKGGFFSESANGFFKSPNLKKEIFQKTILNLKFKIPTHNKQYYVIGGNFKFLVQQ